MIYQESLSKFKTEVAEAIEELFELAYKNQSHPQDLLLVDQHGFFGITYNFWGVAKINHKVLTV
jgi:hypothetical protein